MSTPVLIEGSLALSAGSGNVRTLRFRADGKPWGKAGMPTIDMTDRAVNKPALGSGTYKIKGLAGFMLVCNAQSASFVLQRRVEGRSVRVKLGARGEMTVKQAYDAAIASLATMRAGKNPNEERKQARVKGMTLAEAFRIFMDSKEYAPKTVDLYTDTLDRHLKAWKERPLESIGRDRAGVRDLHVRLTKNVGWSAANNTCRLLRAIYNRAMRQVPTLPANPVKNVDFNPERTRDTALDDDSFPSWYAQVMKLSNPVKRVYWVSVLLTGGRREQMAKAEWSEVDLQSGTWRFPPENVKRGQAYSVPLSSFMMDLLKEWKQWVDANFPDKSGWVFPSHFKNQQHIKSPRNEKQGLETSAHPLRHSFRTHGVGVRLSEVEAKLLMGHKLRGVSEGYITRHLTVDYMRPLQEEMSQHFLEKIGITKEVIKEIIHAKVARGGWKKKTEETIGQ